MTRTICVVLGRGVVGWGGILTIVVIVLKKRVKCCGLFQEPCTVAHHAHDMCGVGVGGWGGAGRDAHDMYAVGVGWGGIITNVV